MNFRYRGYRIVTLDILFVDRISISCMSLIERNRNSDSRSISLRLESAKPVPPLHLLFFFFRVKVRYKFQCFSAYDITVFMKMDILEKILCIKNCSFFSFFFSGLVITRKNICSQTLALLFAKRIVLNVCYVLGSQAILGKDNVARYELPDLCNILFILYCMLLIWRQTHLLFMENYLSLLILAIIFSLLLG